MGTASNSSVLCYRPIPSLHRALFAQSLLALTRSLTGDVVAQLFRSCWHHNLPVMWLRLHAELPESVFRCRWCYCFTPLWVCLPLTHRWDMEYHIFTP
ncbi:hypothetical protein LY78DRAFT_318973 [Colletotrichum sublineola]|nr:hypothetical protein LY78DRAFT_318973 [Colletotrichum sublineola]